MLEHSPQRLHTETLQCLVSEQKFRIYRPHNDKNMKKSLTIGASYLHYVKKALLIMKFTFLLLTIAMLQVSAKVNGQAKVSLQSDKEEIARVLAKIEKQSNYRFLYNNALEGMKRKISINVHELEISEALNLIFTGTDLTYKM